MKHKYKVTRLSMLISGLFIVASPFAYAVDTTTEVGKVTVQSQDSGQSTSTGLIQAEESPKARSSVDRTYMDKQQGTSNPYQMIGLLPGVNTYDQDGTGLFGGNIRVRGFNSDQLGFTINGAPVNDSGNFAVYPQEYTDSENLCDIYVTQGSTDTEAPHVGATGGNIGMNTCTPEDARRFRVETIIGSHNLRKYYARVDSGKILNDRFKFFISYSKTQVDKFKGEGGADKEHTDFNSKLTLDNGSYIDTAVLYNTAINNNYRSLTKAQIAQYGTNYDFGTQMPVHQPGVNGTAQNDSTYAPNAGISNGPKNLYYAYNINPFDNWLATMNGHFQITPKSAVDVSPYMWYGYGTGGNELQTITEGNASTLLAGGVKDVNKDGDTKDTVYAYEGSVTKTYRPGITTKFTQQFDDQRVMFGYWFERARQQQTAPYSAIAANGVPADLWLNNPTDYLQNQNGSAVEYRNAMTINTGRSLFAQDNINLMQDKLNVQLGARYSGIERNFTNEPSQSSPAFYTLDKEYTSLLPSLGLRYQLDQADSVFFNATKNFKAPGNFSYFNLVSGGSIVNGTYAGGTMRDVPVDKETSWNFDLGYRYTSDKWTFSSSIYYIDFKNRIATSYNPDTDTNTDFNVGDATSKGFELETGYAITKNWSMYASLSYIKSHMDSDIPWTVTSTLPTAGKEFPDTPNWLSGLNLQYTEANWYVFSQAKYTGKRYSTLVNDDSIGGYVTTSAGAGYTFESNNWLKKPTLKFNVNNMFDRNYLSLSSGSGSQFTSNAYAIGNIPASAPSFYVSPPRTFSLTLVADF
ncbi:TonB-dependent receptor [Solimicrobium silvestre]|uniref:TonB dependent receptor n=1 Tax=Solimicrobium silvestre TaxID=2099400 RepID=A0A2S9H3X1_9BURK|nr:TonB-dependent receptor [Solimicrobium silvestre]PRC94684.1 TonB dependent receptor [Solimicrobium silvestre]